MNRRNFFKALGALACAPLAKLLPAPTPVERIPWMKPTGPSWPIYWHNIEWRQLDYINRWYTDG